MKTKSKALVLPDHGSCWDVLTLGIVVAGFVMLLLVWLSSNVVVVHADNFTDVFYTNSFRGSFEWFKKLDWIGMIVQAVISIFSLVGVSLIVIRVMTSMLYLSARGLWEEVHDLKQGGESEMYDFGFISMAKSWAKGKAGTGLDAIFGAVLLLLPDVKKYSDFGERSGQSFDEDISISQYILKIALPVVLAVFFFAMGFNGTLMKGLAVTVDAMGTAADKAVSVNYSGFVEDLVNSGLGYKFTFEMDGTEKGKLEQAIAKDLYGRIISEVRGANQAQLYQIGINVQTYIEDNFENSVVESRQIAESVREGLTAENGDQFYGLLSHNIVVNTSATASTDDPGVMSVSSTDLLNGVEGIDASTSDYVKYYHIFVWQSTNTNDYYFNFDDPT